MTIILFLGASKQILFDPRCLHLISSCKTYLQIIKLLNFKWTESCGRKVSRLLAKLQSLSLTFKMYVTFSNGKHWHAAGELKIIKKYSIWISCTAKKRMMVCHSVYNWSNIQTSDICIYFRIYLFHLSVIKFLLIFRKTQYEMMLFHGKRKAVLFDFV